MKRSSAEIPKRLLDAQARMRAAEIVMMNEIIAAFPEGCEVGWYHGRHVRCGIVLAVVGTNPNHARLRLRSRRTGREIAVLVGTVLCSHPYRRLP